MTGVSLGSGGMSSLGSGAQRFKLHRIRATTIVFWRQSKPLCACIFTDEDTSSGMNATIDRIRPIAQGFGCDRITDEKRLPKGGTHLGPLLPDERFLYFYDDQAAFLRALVSAGVFSVPDRNFHINRLKWLAILSPLLLLSGLVAARYSEELGNLAMICGGLGAAFTLLGVFSLRKATRRIEAMRDMLSEAGTEAAS